MMALLQQLLYSESLSLSWRDIIVPVVRQVVQTVRPDVRNCDDDMDIRQLVHIKKVNVTGSRGFCLFFLVTRIFFYIYIPTAERNVLLCFCIG